MTSETREETPGLRLKLTCKGCRRNIEIEGEHIPGDMLCPDCDRPLPIPKHILNVDQEIGGFKVVKHLGSGSMGCVYEAIQMSMQRPVALKVLDPELTQKEDEVDSFLQEVRALARLDHPHIVTAFEAGEDQGQYFLAMTMVDGFTLDELVEREGPMDEQQGLQTALAVAEALEYTWREHHILHRDVKPANIMIHRDGSTKLLDVGIALAVEKGVDAVDQPEEKMLVGTPYYISPEQTHGDHNLDCRSDIYALAASMFHVLTGRVPFDDPDMLEIVHQHRSKEPPDAREVNPELSTATAELLRRLMAKAPDDRARDWNDVIHRLKHLQREARQDAAAADDGADDRDSGADEKPKRKLHAHSVDDVSRRFRDRQQKGTSTTQKAIYVLGVLVLLGALFYGVLRVDDLHAYVRTHIFKTADPEEGDPPPTEPEPEPVPGARPPAVDEPVDAPGGVALPLLDSGSGGYAVAFWLKTAADGTIFAKTPRRRWRPQSKALVIRDGRLGFVVEGAGIVRGRKVITDRKWHYIVFCGASPQEIYVDGERDVRGTLACRPDPGRVSVFKLGDAAGRFRERFLIATIDDLRFYNGRLTAAEVQGLYRSPSAEVRPVLAAHWRFNGDLSESTAQAYHTTLIGNADYAPGRDKQAFVFNGTTTLILSSADVARKRE